MRASRRLLAFAASAPALLAAACGGGALPPPEPCPSATPTTAARATRSVSATEAALRTYFVVINHSEQRLKAPTADFTAKWPSGKFSRSDSFRSDLAHASDRAICAARDMMAVTPPDSRLAAYDAAVDAVLTGYSERLQAGREAAESRNVSTFREWLAAVNGLQAELDAARSQIPSGLPVSR